MSLGLPQDPFGDDPLDAGRATFHAILDAARESEPEPVIRALSALDERDLRAALLAHVLDLLPIVEEGLAEQQADEGVGRLRRAWRAAVREWRS